MRHPATLARRQFLAASAAVAGLSFTRRGWAQQDLLVPLREGLQLRVHSRSPLNAEPELDHLLAESPTTVERHFYIRNHGPIPKIEAADLKLQIDGLVAKPQTLSLADVREKYKSTDVQATLTCAGNRREEHHAKRPVGGVLWSAGAIGNATWSGARLADVLRSMEIKPEAKHVWFEGLDPIKEKDGSQAPFGGSIPLDKALAGGDQPCLLAYAMNGAALAPEHGFPLRTLVPGYIGARSVKWLTKITLADRPSPNHYVADAYKMIQKQEEAKDRDPIYDFVINSAICEPAAGAMLKAGRNTIRGYALPTGAADCKIDKVELSLDNGKTWQDAKLASKPQPFIWTLWSLDVDLPAGPQTLIVRATDTKGRRQPEQAELNFKGYQYNAWHQIAVEAA